MLKKIKIFADGANIEKMKASYKKGLVCGFTTNPTLLKQAGVKNYLNFAKNVLSEIKDLPISFEVFSDDFDVMEQEAKVLSSLGNNVIVKIPITNTKGKSSIPLIKKLSSEGFLLNITAVMTLTQVREISEVINKNIKTIVSVFAGRIADTGRNPVPYIKKSLELLSSNPNAEILWASPREVFNIIQAEEIGCHIITLKNDLLNKISLFGKDLNQFSIETVKMFYDDAKQAGYTIL